MFEQKYEELKDRMENAVLRYAMGGGSDELDQIAQELLELHKRQTDRVAARDPGMSEAA